MDRMTRQAMEAALDAAIEFHEVEGDTANGSTIKAEHWKKFQAALDNYCLRRGFSGLRREMAALESTNEGEKA